MPNALVPARPARSGRSGAASACALVAAFVVALLALVLLGGTPAARADVDDFTFASFDGRYELGIDEEGHSTLTTVEEYVAVFPEIDQNKGIRRALPLRYQGHPTDLELVSVTDENGAPRPFETETDDENLIVTIAAADYVHGEQSYVLTYTQRDVTGYFADTDDDEFYRDTNGTISAQPIAVHTTTTIVAPELVSALTGETGCFVGPEGSTETCEILRAGVGTSDDAEPDTTSGGEPTDPTETAVFTTRNEDLGPGENVTIGIAFQPHTFTLRDTAYLSAASSWVQLIATLLALLVAALSIVYRVTVLRDARGRPVVVPEFTTPPGVDLMLASAVMKRPTRAAAASFVDFAVRRNIQILEQDDALAPGAESAPGSKAVYWLRLLTAEGLNAAELELARGLFGPELASGAWRELKAKDTELAKQIQALRASTRKRVLSEGYFRSGTAWRGSLLLIAAFVLAIVSFITGAMSLEAALGGPLPVVAMVVAIAVIVVVLATAFRSPLTAKGAELRDYVEGIKMYIEWAEEERFRVLQSPEGALRTGIDAPDRGQVVRLYEKLLPYAVLLGLETEWAKVLGTYYENLGTEPDWYGGSTGFNSYLFASSISALSSSTVSAFSGTSSSSSSGFSGGGGSSGGGGGGGGVGGV
ncbi:DUF2207 domain-containing protein [Herbiconiux sp. CPCC 203407]|uniref:DUF2207 domain-containing protein n=1 Tax=Herbiconiux oxytropis TaxID=2970915 RepID=A0AA41XC03_9MICO|nr:DUF2207 domain-containing protein [Herbiconiux oxytropis]MCS5723752.1 DUF2207 domain-containing protein [Herbiconiux oxytropis]MCS5725252.1 DUF2207 domain-containing protein [Herbiconiux oxytropis]